MEAEGVKVLYIGEDNKVPDLLREVGYHVDIEGEGEVMWLLMEFLLHVS